MNAAEFNARYGVGVRVFAYTGFRPEDDADARPLVTRTRSRAELFQGHTDVVWVEGHDACIQLSHIDVVSEDVWEAARTADAVAELGALPMPVGVQQPPFPPAPRDFEEKLRQDVARLQGLLAEAVAAKHLADRERDLMRERVSEPFGCKYCGAEKRWHGRRSVSGLGVHGWERPSDEQVKARMLARRAARLAVDVAHDAGRRDRYAKALYEFVNGALVWEACDDPASWLEEADAAIVVADAEQAELKAQLAEFDALELGAVDGRISAACQDPEHPTWLRKPGDKRGCPWCRIAEVEALKPAAIQTCRVCGAGYSLGDPCAACEFQARMAAETARPKVVESADRLTQFFAPVASLREDEPAEVVRPQLAELRALLAGQREALDGEHYPLVHHDYTKGREIPGSDGPR